MGYEFSSSFDNQGTFMDGVSAYGSEAPATLGQSWGNVATPGYFGTFYGDAVEQQRFDGFTPSAGANDSRPWYERVAEYGLGRYIDNRLGPTEVNRTNVPGTFAGQNGRTYTNVPVQGGQMSGSNMLVIGAAAIAALLLLK